MTSTLVILAALSIMTGGSPEMDMDNILGQNKQVIVDQVLKLQGSKITKVKNTIDILARYNLDIQLGSVVLLSGSIITQGVSYSTDPSAHPKYDI